MERAQMTQQILADSLKKLASEKLFEHVTVRDIVEDCGVNRQTFYYHFSDKYELLDWIYYNETFVPLTKDISFDNWDEKLCELFKIMKNNRAFYMNTIKCSNNFFEEYLLKMLTTLLKTAIDDLDIYSHLTAEKKTMYARIFAHGLAATITEWAMSGMKENEETMAHDMKELVDCSERIAYEIYNYKKETGDFSLSGRISEVDI